MTPAEMDTILRGLGWSRTELARRLGRTEGVVRRWRVVPEPVEDWLLNVRRWGNCCPTPPAMPKKILTTSENIG